MRTRSAVRRRSQLAPVQAVLGSATRAPRVPWDGVVGRALAAASAPVGVDADGTLRIMAADDPTRRELLARSEHVAAAWNTLSGGRGRTVRGLVCWVKHGFVAPEAAPRERAPAPPSADDLAAGQRLAAGIRDPRLRDLIARAHASARAKFAREADPGTGSAGGAGADEEASG